MQRYSKYKDSTIEWIGKIPVDWNIFTMRQVGHFDGSGIDKKINKNEVLVKMVNYTDIYDNKSLTLDNKRDYMIVSCPVEKLNKVLVKKGDLIFTPSSETVKDIGLSSVAIEDLDNTVYSYHVLRYKFSEKVNINFSKYICNNYFVLNWFSKLALGTIRKTLSREDFKSTRIILPPLVKQKEIADFLDDKTEKIGALISDKEKLIELLKEQRQSIISETITKGLDKKVQMKPSGIEWIGDIPVSWKTKKLKYMAELYPKYTLSNITNDMNVTFSPMESVKTGILEQKLSKFSNYNSSYNIFKNGDILMAKVTPCFENRNIIIAKNLSNGIGFGSSELFVIRCFNVNTEYMFYYFQSNVFMEMAKSTMYGVAGLKRVSSNFVRNSQILFPSREEQKKIVNYLNEKTSQIDKLIENITKQIKKLQEYRKSIISEAVTGKAAI
jgi:type I restriction enzyme S subunit